MSARSSALAANSFGLNRLLNTLEYAKKRKHALLAMILAEVGVMPFQSMASNPDRFADEAVHLFSRLYLTAMSVMRRRWRPAYEDTRQEVGFLTSTQGKNGGWEQQSLITILALLSLGPASASFDGGLRFLKSVTREDGGVAFTDNLNLWTTALAALALQRSKAIPEAVFHRIAEYFVARQQPNGGWAFSEDVNQTDTDTSSQCAQVLIQLDPERYAEPIARAHEYFLRLQRPDGGYPTYELAGESEITMAANIALVQSLCLDRRPDLRESIQKALAFVRARQKPDGTFERSWSLCDTYSIFRVNLALNGCRDADDDPAATAEVQQRALKYLLDNQYESGGWGQTSKHGADALSTAYGLLSLAILRRQVQRENIELAEKYLISQQDPATGEFTSVPDVVGPRPMVFNIPLLSTIFSVWALSVAENI
jgi:prenyltransferase beta subunit